MCPRAGPILLICCAALGKTGQISIEEVQKNQQTCKKGQRDDCEGPHVAEASSRQLMILH